MKERDWDKWHPQSLFITDVFCSKLELFFMTEQFQILTDTFLLKILLHNISVLVQHSALQLIRFTDIIHENEDSSYKWKLKVIISLAWSRTLNYPLNPNWWNFLTVCCFLFLKCIKDKWWNVGRTTIVEPMECEQKVESYLFCFYFMLYELLISSKLNIL